LNSTRTILDTIASAQQILDYLEEIGLKISKRTPERDFDAIRNEFGVEITFDKSKRGYYIDEASSIDIPAFIRFLEIANTSKFNSMISPKKWFTKHTFIFLLMTC